MTTFDDQLAQARAILTQEPDRKVFLSLCTIVEKSFRADSTKTEEVLLPYLLEYVKEWPAKLRQAPLLWINKLAMGLLPPKALSLTSALCLGPALTHDYRENKLYPHVIEWFRQLDESTPQLEGLSFSLRTALIHALRKEMALDTHKSCHPSVQSDRFYKHEEFARSGFGRTDALTTNEDFDLILSSPLCRSLRVLDLSLDAFEGDERNRLAVRLPEDDTFKINTIAKVLTSEELEVLDCQGNIHNDCGVAFSDSYVNFYSDKLERLSALKQLNVGGGVRLGDKQLKMIVKNFTNLETLSMVPGFSPGVEEDEELDTSTGYGYELDRNWGFYDADSIRSLNLTRQGGEALLELEKLHYIDIGWGGYIVPEELKEKIYVVKPREKRPIEAYKNLWCAHFEP